MAANDATPLKVVREYLGVSVEFLDRVGGDPTGDEPFEGEALLDPEVVWIPIEDPREFRGTEGIRGVVRQWMDAMQGWTVEPFAFEQIGGRVVVGIRIEAQGRSSGISTQQTIYSVFTVAGGRITRMHEFADREAAEREARLGERA